MNTEIKTSFQSFYILVCIYLPIILSLYDITYIYLSIQMLLSIHMYLFDYVSILNTKHFLLPPANTFLSMFKPSITQQRHPLWLIIIVVIFEE